MYTTPFSLVAGIYTRREVWRLDKAKIHIEIDGSILVTTVTPIEVSVRSRDSSITTFSILRTRIRDD